MLIILACNNSYAEDVTFCNNNEDLQKCIDNAPTRTISLLEGVYLTNGIHIGSNTTFIIPENTTLKLADDAELDGAAFGGDANFVIASLGKPKQLIENVHLVINGEVDGNKGVHVYEQGGVEGIDWKWVKNSTISGSGVVHSANGDGIDLDAVHNSKISGLTVRENGDSGIHFGSPRPIMPSTNNIVIGVTSINNGFRIGKSGFDLSWPNPDGAIYVNCVAIDNYRNYKMEATGGAIYNSSSINNGGVIKEDYFGDVGYALVNGKDLTSSNFISMRTKILIKRDIRKLLGMSYHSYLDGLEY
ncbi:hypothetical protein DA442_01225 [Vibrio parahaemolyticus]|nr:hypothetical protein DA442_01225 [Vibrio parahaemolyticus]